MGIEINAHPGKKITTLGPRTDEYMPDSLQGKTFKGGTEQVFGSYNYALIQNGLSKTDGDADIQFETKDETGKIEVKIIVGKNAVLVTNLLSIAPTELANILVQKALALGKITLPAQLQKFIQPQDMVGGDLRAIIMGRYVHITPDGEIWTPPQLMIGGRDTWHKVKPADSFNLILPDWLHGGLKSVSMNTSVEGGVLEGITWKKQKIRIKPNGEITQVVDDAEVTLDKKEHINLIIPDCLIGKISFNGETNHLPLFGTVGDRSDEKNNEYICIKAGGVVEKMGKPGGWSRCSAEEIKRLGEYPTQKEITRMREEKRKKRMNRFQVKLKKGE